MRSGFAWPLAVGAQQVGKLPTIGFFGVATALAHSPRTAAFVERLHELGWTEGRSVAIEYRWERFSEITAEFIRLKVDVIVTTMSGAVAAKKAMSIIPCLLIREQIPFQPALSRAWRDPVATSPAYRTRRPISPVSGSNFCARWCLICAGWEHGQPRLCPRRAGSGRGSDRSRLILRSDSSKKVQGSNW
jgi:hypothetical protein